MSEDDDTSPVSRMLDKLDFLEHRLLGSGRLGMTSVPGRDGSRWETDPLGRDMRALALLNAHRIVCLLPTDELEALGASELGKLCAEHGISFSQLAVVDGQAPRDQHEFRRLVHLVVSELSEGRTVVAHCRAGFGRTGTFAACCLVEKGAAAHTAIAQVRALRRYAVESKAQEEFVFAFEHATRSREDDSDR